MAFSPIKNHVLLPVATALLEADRHLKPKLSTAVLQDIVKLIPDSWLNDDLSFPDTATHRAAYLNYLLDRLAHAEIFVEEALRAREQLV